MLNEKQIKDIERQLDSLADVYYDSRNPEIKERNREIENFIWSQKL